MKQTEGGAVLLYSRGRQDYGGRPTISEFKRRVMVQKGVLFIQNLLKPFSASVFNDDYQQRPLEVT